MLAIAPSILSNLITVLGVLYYDWDIGWLLLLFLVDSIILGIFNLWKIKLASKKPVLPDKSKQKDAVIKGSIGLSLSINGRKVENWNSFAFSQFFLGFYGMIIIFLSVLLSRNFEIDYGSFVSFAIWLLNIIFEYYIDLRNFAQTGKNKQRTKVQQTLLPIFKLFVLSLPVIVSIFLLRSFDNNIPVLLSMVSSKLLIDILFILKPSTYLIVSYGDMKEVI